LKSIGTAPPCQLLFSQLEIVDKKCIYRHFTYLYKGSAKSNQGNPYLQENRAGGFSQWFRNKFEMPIELD